MSPEIPSLQAILGDHPQAFIEHAWGQRSVFFPANGRSFASLLSEEGLPELLASCTEDAKVGFREGGRQRELRIAPSEALQQLALGRTVCVQNLHRAVPSLAQFVQDARSWLRSANEARAGIYWSPDGAGFAEHFDDSHVFLLQVRGNKRWRHGAAPALPHPPANLLAQDLTHYRSRRPWLALEAPGELEERVLRPGDALYLPPGTWHEARAEGESLGITLSFHPPSLLRLLERGFRESLEANEAYRASPPPVIAAQGCVLEDLPAVVRSALDAQLDALRIYLAAVRAEDLAIDWAERAYRGLGAAGRAPRSGMVGFFSDAAHVFRGNDAVDRLHVGAEVARLPRPVMDQLLACIEAGDCQPETLTAALIDAGLRAEDAGVLVDALVRRRILAQGGE